MEARDAAAEPPAKKRRSRFGPTVTQEQPRSEAPPVRESDTKRAKALGIAAQLSNLLGDSFGGAPAGGPNDFKPLEPESYPFHKRVYAPVDQEPQCNFIGLVLGKGGATQRRLQQETRCRILVKGKGSARESDDPGEPLFVEVSAHNIEDLTHGERRIQEIFFDPAKRQELKSIQSINPFALGALTEAPQMPFRQGLGFRIRHSMEEDPNCMKLPVKIPAECVGIVIGKQGQTIRRIQDMTNTVLRIQRGESEFASEMQDPGVKTVTVMGDTMACCEDAREEVYKLLEQVVGYRPDVNGHPMRVDHFGTRSNFEPTPTTSISHPNPQTLAAIEQMNANGFPEHMLPPVVGGDMATAGFCDVDIPSTAVGLLIGKQGETIKAICDRTSCDVRVKRDAESDLSLPTRVVTLRGSILEIQAARQEIAAIIHGPNHTKRKDEAFGASLMQAMAPPSGGMYGPPLTVRVPEREISKLVGVGGDMLREIQRRTRAIVTVGDNPIHNLVQVSIDGPPDTRFACKAEIDRLLGFIIPFEGMGGHMGPPMGGAMHPPPGMGMGMGMGGPMMPGVGPSDGQPSFPGAPPQGVPPHVPPQQVQPGQGVPPSDVDRNQGAPTMENNQPQQPAAFNQPNGAGMMPPQQAQFGGYGYGYPMQYGYPQQGYVQQPQVWGMQPGQTPQTQGQVPPVNQPQQTQTSQVPVTNQQPQTAGDPSSIVQPAPPSNVATAAPVVPNVEAQQG